MSLGGGEPERKAALGNERQLDGSEEGEWGSRIREYSTTRLPNYTIHKEVLYNRNFYLQLFFLLRGNLWRIKRFEILNQVITKIRGFNASLQNLRAHPTQEVLNCGFSEGTQVVVIFVS